MILEKIIKKKKVYLEMRKETSPLNSFIEKIKYKEGEVFKKAIAKKGINIIAEIKRASPSKGILNDSLNPIVLAGEYEKAGAAAISVLTEKDYFLGSDEDLTKVKATVGIPVLRKDFIIEEYQIYEASYIGADAVLLIKSILTKEKLKKYIALASQLGLAALVEVHTKEELEEVLECDAEIIGINNRNLKTFQTDINITLELADKVPGGKLLVSESGIFSGQDIKILREAGINAFLIGEALVKSGDVMQQMREFNR